MNTELNQWCDFGIGKGGNIIALAQELYGSDYVPYLLGKIAEQAPHVRPVSFSFCCNDILALLANTYVKAEKHQVRRVLQEYWKLTPAPNGLTYTTYQVNYNRDGMSR